MGLFKRLWEDRFRFWLLVGLLVVAFILLLGGPAPVIGGVDDVNTGTTLDLPFFGEIDAASWSLPLLAVILGLVDGFNPCAMWVLVYLISVILTLRDKKRVWILVGSFVLASGILYFLFMTAWLNLFLVIGFVRPISIIIGLGALWIGITNLRDYYLKHVMECEVGDAESKRKTTKRIDRLVNSPLTWVTVLGMIGLAFVVNSIEFVCSSGIPAVFTQVLALSELPTLTYYLYILLYVAFFMLDDLIIFGLAAFTVSAAVGERYAKWCKLIGGLILVLLGFVLAFMPHVLR